MRLLVAHQDPELANALSALLERNLYAVDVVPTGTDALAYALAGEYDGLILHTLTPELSGQETVRKLRREQVGVPIMLLTHRDTPEDRIAGFDAGADDCLSPPFPEEELLSRLRAMLRRRESYTPTLLRFGDLCLNCSSGMISCGDRVQRLSAREFQILELFMRSPRVILSSERIMERVWGWDAEAAINVVWVHLSNLRKKLRAVGSQVTVRTSRGLGYTLERIP